VLGGHPPGLGGVALAVARFDRPEVVGVDVDRRGRVPDVRERRERPSFR
jgi:hypothetical protein